MLKACQKRPVKMTQLEEIVNEVESMLHERADKEIPVQDIGELVIRKLQELDKVAFVRFASVYRDFKDINQFMDELKQLLKTK
jgi:transcriptional repressor NrdR